MNRKNGMTSIEITISLALILLFFSMIFPILRMTLKLEGSFLFQERIERNSSRLVEMLTKEIESSSFGEEEYRGKENLINGKGIYQLVGVKPSSLNESFFNDRREEGNMLFLEIPCVKNGKIYSKYYMYRFVGDTFLVSQCTNEFKNIYTNEEFILFDYVSGYFKQDKKGIKIVMKVKKEKNYIRELKDYALKGRKW